MASDALKIVTHEDALSAKKPPFRVAEQVPSNDGEPDKFMELLGDIDGLKQEIHDRMRRLEAVKQARSLLLEDAERTEALNKRLQEFGKIMSAVNSGVATPEKEHVEAERSLRQSRETPEDGEPRHPAAKVKSESGTLPWVRPETPGDLSADEGHDTAGPTRELSGRPDTEIPMEAEAKIALEEALKRMEQAEQTREQVWNKADEATLEAKRLFEESSSRLELAFSKEEQATAELFSAKEALEQTQRSASEQLKGADQAWNKANEAVLEARRLLEESTQRLELAVSKEETSAFEFQSSQEKLETAYRLTDEKLEAAEEARVQAWKEMDRAAVEARGLLEESNSRLNLATEKADRAGTEFRAAQEALEIGFKSANERLIVAEQLRVQAWKKSDEAALEARRLFEESAARLEAAIGKEESARNEFHLAQESLSASIQGANERLQQAEGYWRKADQTMADANRLLEEASTNLDRVVSRGNQVTAEFDASEKALATAYQAANQRLEEAERFWKDSDQAISEAKKRMDQSTFQLTEAKAKGDVATADLQSARQELTTAYQFASVAAQRRLDAADIFQKAVRWAVFATAFSWIAMVWAVWSAFRAHVPVFVPCILMVLVVAAAFGLGRIGTREA